MWFTSLAARDWLNPTNWKKNALKVIDTHLLSVSKDDGQKFAFEWKFFWAIPVWGQWCFGRERYISDLTYEGSKTKLETLEFVQTFFFAEDPLVAVHR